MRKETCRGLSSLVLYLVVVLVAIFLVAVIVSSDLYKGIPAL